MLEIDGVTQTRNGATATLVVNSTNVASFTNRDVNCNDDNHYFYLFLSDDSKCTTQCKHYSRGRDMTYSISNIQFVSLNHKHCIRRLQNKMCDSKG